MGDFFFDAIRGDLKSLEDYVNSFLDTLASMISQYFASLLWSKIPLGAMFGGAAAAAPSAAGSAISFKQHGGIISRPTIFPTVAGEKGAEAILPLTKTSGGDLGVKSEGGGGSGITNLNIYALDAQSFVEMANRVPEAIVGPIQTALQNGNRGLIETVRSVL
jgi:phage-related minor tail protein